MAEKVTLLPRFAGLLVLLWAVSAADARENREWQHGLSFFGLGLVGMAFRRVRAQGYPSDC